MIRRCVYIKLTTPYTWSFCICLKRPISLDFKSTSPPISTFCGWFSIKLCGYIHTHETNLSIHFLNEKADTHWKNIFLLTLSLLRRPKPPVKNGTQWKNSIFNEWVNHVSTLVLLQALVISSTFESQWGKYWMSFLPKVVSWSEKSEKITVLHHFSKGKIDNLCPWIFGGNFYFQQTNSLSQKNSGLVLSSSQVF